MVLRNARVLQRGEQGFRLHFHVLRDLDDLRRKVRIFRVDAEFLRLLGFEPIGVKALDRRVARRVLVQDAQQFHALVDVDVGDRIAIDAGDDDLGGRGTGRRRAVLR